ncbi:MAG: hypothetical protein LKJ88_02210 [Bacilli bacterium]|jgi:hypothetical protein|nr:hypothetical protein [Bacilli bacterium]
MKKHSLSLLACSSVAFLLFSCNVDTLASSNVEIGTFAAGESLSVQDAFAYETVMGLSSLSGANIASTPLLRGGQVSSLTDSEKTAQEEEMLNYATSYLGVVDQAYRKGQIVTKVQEASSDNPAYTNKTSISFLGQDGKAQNVVIYYNIVPTATETETSSSQSETTTSSELTSMETTSASLGASSRFKDGKGHKGYDHDFHDGKDEDAREELKEVSEEIAGEVIYQNTSYPMGGRSGVDENGNSLTAFGFYYTDTAYIKVRQMTYEGKSLFKLTQLEDNKVISSYSLGVFTEDGVGRVYIKAKDIDEKSFSRYTFFTLKEVDYILAKIKKSGYNDYHFLFERTLGANGEVTYQYIKMTEDDNLTSSEDVQSSEESSSLPTSASEEATSSKEA